MPADFRCDFLLYRTRQSVDTKYKLTIEELTLFYKEITALWCELKESDGVKFILDQVLQFQKDAEELESKEEDCDVEKLEKCIDFGDSICIELPQLVRLKQVHKKSSRYASLCLKLTFHEQ